MKKIVCVLSVLVLLGTGCDINQLDFSGVKAPKPEGVVALPLGYMTWSMEDVMSEVTAIEYEIDEFNGVVLNYTDTVEAEFPYAGSVPIDLIDTIPLDTIEIPLDFFNRFDGSGIYFQNPQVNFTFINTINAPMFLDFSGTYVVRTDSVTGEETRINLEGDIIDNPKLIRSPSNEGESTETTLSLNQDNSNLRDLFNLSPTLIHIEISAIVQLSSSATIAEDASLTTGVEVKLPLALILEDFEIPLEVDIGENFEFDYADSLALHMVTANMLPFTVLLTFQIIGESEDTLYQVYRQKVIAPPRLDSWHEANTPQVQISDIPLSPAGISALNSGTKIRAILKLDTSESLNSQEIYVRILINYFLEIELGIVGKINPDSGLF
jgi:hypothetical protein